MFASEWIPTETVGQDGFIPLPAHLRPGGFDHAAIHHGRRRLYVAHTGNDAVDIVDLDARRFLGSVPDLRRPSGVLVSEEHDLVVAACRGEDRIGIFQASDCAVPVMKVNVGHRPTGLAYDASRGLLLVANAGNPATISLVRVDLVEEVARLRMPGRTGWPVHDPERSRFLVPVSEPARIALVPSRSGGSHIYYLLLPAERLYGLALDARRRRLYCSCDAGRVLCLDADSGVVLDERAFSGQPDVILLDSERARLYLAVGDPGTIEVFDSASLEHLQSVATEPGTHSLARDTQTHALYALMPQTNGAGLYRVVDVGSRAYRLSTVSPVYS